MAKGLRRIRDSVAELFCYARNGLRSHDDGCYPTPYMGCLNYEKLVSPNERGQQGCMLYTLNRVLQNKW